MVFLRSRLMPFLSKNLRIIETSRSRNLSAAGWRVITPCPKSIRYGTGPTRMLYSLRSACTRPARYIFLTSSSMESRSRSPCSGPTMLMVG